MRARVALALAGLGALSLFLAGFYSPFADDASTVSERTSLVWLVVACATIGLSVVGATSGGRAGALGLALAASLNAATIVVILVAPPGKLSTLG